MKKQIACIVTLAFVLIIAASSFTEARVLCKQGTSFKYHATATGINTVWGGWTLNKAGKWCGSLTAIGNFCILIDQWGGPGDRVKIFWDLPGGAFIVGTLGNDCKTIIGIPGQNSSGFKADYKWDITIPDGGYQQ